MVKGEATFPIPAGIGSLIGSRLLTVREKWRLARFLTTLPKLDTRQFNGVPVSDWLDRAIGSGNLALLLGSLFRVSTYCNDPEQMSAGVALTQLRLALAGNVWYLDGGWQTLVDGLSVKAIELGADIRTGTRAKSVHSGGGGVLVELASGEELRAQAAVLAVDPETARDLLGMPVDSALARWVASSVPIRAACLDLALNTLTRPDNRFALGLDRPLYYSVHSSAAKLAPEGVAIVHVMKYLGNDTTTSSGAALHELESLLDQLQPGWREHIVARRFLPGMTVAHSVPRAQEGGHLGRPAVVVSECPNVFLAGDWVGPLGILADASATSAAESAQITRWRFWGARPRSNGVRSMSQADEIFEEHRPALARLAYRMLGSLADADDVLQEAYLRWARDSREAVQSPRAYLLSIVTRLCIDQRQSVEARKITYVGPWLPEPVVEPVGSAVGVPLETAESVSMALLLVLESLSPVERAADLLRRIFDYDYDVIAQVLEKSEPSCRQIVRSQAEQRIYEQRPRFETTTLRRQSGPTDAFLPERARLAI